MRSENNAKTRKHKAEQRNTVLVLSLNTKSSCTKSLQMVIATMKLKDAYPGKESYDQPR